MHTCRWFIDRTEEINRQGNRKDTESFELKTCYKRATNFLCLMMMMSSVVSTMVGAMMPMLLLAVLLGR